jgi:hypothetical protein
MGACVVIFQWVNAWLQLDLKLNKHEILKNKNII